MHFKQCFNRPVIGFVSAGLMNLNDDEDMLEMRADGLWSEGQGAWLLEHDCHNVITDVSLPQQLMEQNRDTQKCIKRAGQSHHGNLKGERATCHWNCLKHFVSQESTKKVKQQLNNYSH